MVSGPRNHFYRTREQSAPTGRYGFPLRGFAHAEAHHRREFPHHLDLHLTAGRRVNLDALDQRAHDVQRLAALRVGVQRFMQAGDVLAVERKRSSAALWITP